MPWLLLPFAVFAVLVGRAYAKKEEKRPAPLPEAPMPPTPVPTKPSAPGSIAPTILVLRKAIDERWPTRKRDSDGIMGDAAHQARKSDHNDGNAIDFTNDPASGPDLEALADALMKDPRTKYVIWNKRIRNPLIDAGAWRPYSGANLHTKHLHLSIVNKSRDDVGPWTLPVRREA